MKILVEISVDRYLDDEIMGEEDLSALEVMDVIESALDREPDIYCESLKLVNATLVKGVS